MEEELGEDDKKFIATEKRIIKENPEMFEALMEFEKTGRLSTIEELKKRRNKFYSYFYAHAQV